MDTIKVDHLRPTCLYFAIMFLKTAATKKSTDCICSDLNKVSVNHHLAKLRQIMETDLRLLSEVRVRVQSVKRNLQ